MKKEKRTLEGSKNKQYLIGDTFDSDYDKNPNTKLPKDIDDAIKLLIYDAELTKKSQSL